MSPSVKALLLGIFMLAVSAPAGAKNADSAKKTHPMMYYLRADGRVLTVKRMGHTNPGQGPLFELQGPHLYRMFSGFSGEHKSSNVPLNFVRMEIRHVLAKGGRLLHPNKEADKRILHEAMYGYTRVDTYDPPEGDSAPESAPAPKGWLGHSDGGGIDVFRRGSQGHTGRNYNPVGYKVWHGG